MKNKEQFDNSIKVLVKAYLEGTLTHTLACSCAVGNLISDSMHCEASNWFDIVFKINHKQDPLLLRNYSLGIKEINSTDYSIEEIILIEKAFESVVAVYDDLDGYKGLCAVFDVLIDIHKGSDKQLKLAKEELIKK